MNENVQVEQETQLTEPVVLDGVESQAPAITVVDRHHEPAVASRAVTVEHALYVLLFVVALLMRFGALTLQPLSPLEATQALPAWMDAMGRDLATSFGELGQAATAHSPLLYSVQRFLFWLTDGGGDGWARVFPALVGSLLVLLPWSLRHWMGRGSALVFALLLAVDPWLLAFSRLSDGAILSVASGLFLWSSLLNWEMLGTGQRRLVAVVAGLFLLSGPLAWLLAPPLLGTLYLFRPAFNVTPGERARLLALFGATILLAGTGALTHWEGLSIVSTSFGVALSYLFGDNLYALPWPFVRLLVDQPLLVVVGLGGVALLWMRAPAERPDGAAPGFPHRRWRLLLSGWLVYALCLWLLPGRNPATLLIVSLPLLLLAASTVVQLWRFASAETDWHDGALIAITLVVLLITTAFLTANYLNQPATGPMDGRILLFYLVLPILVGFFVWWSGWRTTFQVTSLVLLAALFFSLFSSSWTLNLRSELARGQDLFATSPRPGLGLLVADLTRLSAIRSGDPTVASVLVQVDEDLRPLLGWHLRSLQGLRFVGAIDDTILDERTFVVSGQEEIPDLPAGFIGSQYALSSVWLPAELEGASDRLRWWFFRQVRELPAQQVVTLWVRSQ